MKKKIIRISSLIGIVLFVLLVWKIGPDQIWDNIKKITWHNFVILFFLRLFYWMLRTYCWDVILKGYGHRATFLHLFVCRMSSHAVSHLTPSAAVGGEAARIFMLNSSSKKITLASVIVDKTMELLALIALAIVGVGVAVTRISLPVKYQVFLISFVVGGTLLLFLILSKQKQGFIGWIVKLLGKIKIKFKAVERNREKIEETDKYISEFYRNQRKRFWQVFFLYSMLVLVWTMEIHLTLLFIGASNISILDSFVIVTLGSISFSFPIVPASIGIYEATYVGIFALLRLGTDMGLTLVLIRRVIALLWAGVGVLGMIIVNQDRQKKREDL
ncbi:MAG: flippase-like domain-containing protein [Candidatus Aminicenantes bacterium]|nr:flippase-like domain-containing protein [Candidatus Aminicenantes bacterium]